MPSDLSPIFARCKLSRQPVVVVLPRAQVIPSDEDFFSATLNNRCSACRAHTNPNHPLDKPAQLIISGRITSIAPDIIKCDFTSSRPKWHPKHETIHS